MESIRIFDDEGKGYMRVFPPQDVQKVNPIEYFKEHEISKRKRLYRDLLNSTNPSLSVIISDEFLEKYVLNEDLQSFFDDLTDKNLPENFMNLLDAGRKKDQVALLKGMSITPKRLHTWIIRSFSEKGYLFSRILVEILPKGMESKKLPNFVHLTDEGIIEKSGKTELSDGELKNLIKHRKVIIANFLEKDDIWHCIFSTYKGLFGEENYKNGHPHFHYISSSFGVSREESIKSLNSGDYSSTSVHIDLTEYRENEIK